MINYIWLKSYVQNERHLLDTLPVGIGENLNLGDEYDGYIGPIIQILMYTPSIESIISLLKKIENEDMGIENTDTKYLYPIATKLMEIGEKYHI